MVWDKILRTQTKIGQTQLVSPPDHIPRRPELMSDQKEIRRNFFWSVPHRYLPTSAADKINALKVKITENF